MKTLFFIVCIITTHLYAMEQPTQRDKQGRESIRLWLNKAPHFVMQAAQNGSPYSIMEFAQHEHIINCTDELGATPLQIAARYGHEMVAKELLASGALVNHRDHNGNTALMEAVSCGHKKIVQLLLEHRAETHHANIRGYAAYDMAKKAFLFYIDAKSKKEAEQNQKEILLLLAAAQWLEKMKGGREGAVGGEQGRQRKWVR